MKLKAASLLYIVLCATVLTFTVNAQVTRVVLFEEGTNASCGPCAANNPIFKSFSGCASCRSNGD